MTTWDAFYGPNAGYALELYDRYLQDPNAVDADTRAFFEQLAPVDLEAGVDAMSTNGSMAPTAPVMTSNGHVTPVDVNKVVLAARMARSIREYGHLDAHVDPLNGPRPGDPMLDPATHGITDADLAALPASIVWPNAGPEAGTCLDAIHRLCEIYCGPIGYEFDHVQDYDERAWLHSVVESGTFRAPLSPEEQRAILQRLTEVEELERFLHRTFQGQKRFSIEGNDALIPMLDELVRGALSAGTQEVLIGMAHRGRLNVLAHVLEKPYGAIFSEFHDTSTKEAQEGPHEEISSDIDHGWTGDVKYHLGAHREIGQGDRIQMRVTLADNPSHLEVVNPVVEGYARAAQDRRDRPGPSRQNVDRALPITIHGDAAFPGEGVVSETLNLSRLPGYQTGGTVRIIANNQIGFTTVPTDGRSTLYASDLAKGFEIPIVHVNADDPEACLAVVRLAHAYRERFHRDFLIDLIGYRRWGHNEGDEPTFTQPHLYDQIHDHPTVRTLYADRLIAEGVVSPDESAVMQAEIQARLRQAREEWKGGPDIEYRPLAAASAPFDGIETAVPAEELQRLNDELLARPDWFSPHQRLDRLIGQRRDRIDRPDGIDWSMAETLAFASILVDGTPIRLTGQDTERGTFSQRHLVLHDPEKGGRYIPLQNLPGARASFDVYNSPLTETAVLGFEYGYSVHAPDALVLWEAQFGDFANTGQVIIDQFISSAGAKWRQRPSLVLLLPHGYEGQGADHSSARLERYLQLAAEGNLRVANTTTAAQYFHLLRAQARTLSNDRRPLVLMTPKSLLRHPRAASSLDDLTHGTFQPVLDDPNAANRREKVHRLVLCSGKVAVDLEAQEAVEWIAVARLEQLYPFPDDSLRRVIGSYPNLEEVVWVQEEPQNMGAWSYISSLLGGVLPENIGFRFVGRPLRASTAEGDSDVHTRVQKEIVEMALGGDRPAEIETLGAQRVS